MNLGTRQTQILEQTIMVHKAVRRRLTASDLGAKTPDDRAHIYQVWNSLAKHGLIDRLPGKGGTEPTAKAFLVMAAHRKIPVEPVREQRLFGKRIVSEMMTRTVYTDQVIDADRFPLQPGENSPKLGTTVLRGRWKGMPIYSLTLEERATCPQSCAHWTDCYMNNSPRSLRFRHGPELEDRIRSGLWDLDRKHPGGYVVRLHMSGDFYSESYVLMWRDLIAIHPALRVFGYTAHDPFAGLGRMIRHTRALFHDRWAVRFSGSYIKFVAVTIHHKPQTLKIAEGYVCPEQMGKKESCGDCTLCWEIDTPIVFVDHVFL